MSANSFVRMMGDSEVMEIVDTTYIDRLFMDGEFIRLRPAAEFRAIPTLHLRQWAQRKSRYTIVTAELVEWLRKAIRGRSAIEIGAGQGDIGRHLGIPTTDSYCHQRPDVKAYYAMLKTPTCDPPKEVERLEAMEAVAKYRPQVVIGSWITQKSIPTDHLNAVYSNDYGPDHLEIMAAESVECFIMVGNKRVHDGLRALAVQHREFAPPWLVSKARDQDNNRIWVWGN